MICYCLNQESERAFIATLKSSLRWEFPKSKGCFPKDWGRKFTPVICRTFLKHGDNCPEVYGRNSVKRILQIEAELFLKLALKLPWNWENFPKVQFELHFFVL